MIYLLPVSLSPHPFFPSSLSLPFRDMFSKKNENHVSICIFFFYSKMSQRALRKLTESEQQEQCQVSCSPPRPTPQTYHVVDTGEWCVVSDGFKGRASPIAISGGSHFPAELHECLVDACLAAALLHDSISREVRIAGCDTDQGIAWGGGFLDSFLGDFFHMIIVSKGDHLQKSKEASSHVEYQKGRELRHSVPRRLQDF